MLILDLAAEDDVRAKIVADARAAIAAEGTLVGEQPWGVRALAYPIDHRTQAEYQLLQFTGPPSLIAGLEHTLRITDGVVRHRVIKQPRGTAPEAGAGAVRRRRGAPAAGGPAGRPRGPVARGLNFWSKQRRASPGGPAVPLEWLGYAERNAKEPSMAASNINVVVLTGNLTRDPELRSLPSGTSVCDMRIAVNTRRKNGATGEWEDKPNYFDVKVWGAQGENCQRFLSKGRPVAVQGRLEWREWETQDGQKRQAVDIIAESVQFLGGRDEASGGGFTASVGSGSRSDVPVDERDFQTAARGVGLGDDDIPF